MNFSAWNWAANFRLHEAACLIAGVMPISKKYPTSEELPPQAKPILVKLILAYYEWIMQMHDPDRPKVFCLEGVLNPDGSSPLPSLKELTGELVSREAIHRFLLKMEGTGQKSVYDFGFPTPAVLNQDQPKDEATQRAGLIAQTALDRLKKAKTALARREALLISPDRPGGLAEREALESAVFAAEKEVEEAQHAICVMRGDYLDASLEAQPSMLIGTALTETDSIRLVRTTLGLRGVPKSQGLMQGTQLSKQLGKEFLKKGSQPALNPEQKAEIAKLFQQGVSVNKLSTMYPASRRTIDETLKEAGLKLHVTPRKQKKGAQFPPALPLRSRMK